eukprot:gb/GECH01011541.1/.p1 GENE.gb/GECH01011541.1/~~gb/GECH01011541.1/.p1  ORF type:complete len:283 (+),score=64.22 gb/GECH01011541.1/:1-849(+)
MQSYSSAAGSIDKVFKGFDTQKKVFSYSGKSDDGVQFATKATQKDNGSFDGNLTLSKQQALSNGISVNWGVDVGTSGELKVSSKVGNLYPGLKVGATSSLFTDTEKGEKIKFNADYSQKQFCANSSAEYEHNTSCKGTVGSTVGYQGFYVGGEGSMKVSIPDNKKTLNYEGGLVYSPGAYAIAVRLTDNFEKTRAGFSYNKGSNTYAAEYTHNISKKNGEFQAGFAKKLDGASVKGKITDKGMIGLAYSGRFSDNANYVIAAQANASNLSDKFSLGTSISFS